MGRAETAAAGGAIFGLGGAAMMAVAPSLYPALQHVIFWTGAAGMALGAIMMAWGLLHREKPQPPSEFVSLRDAGLWLYSNGSDELKGALEGFTRDKIVYPNLAAAGESYAKTAISQKVCDLYVRWSPDEPYHKADPEDFATFERMVDGQGEFAVRRADLPKLAACYA